MDAGRDKPPSETQATPAPSPDPADSSKPRSESPAWVWWLQVLAMFVVARVAAGFPAVEAAERFLVAHRPVFLGIAITTAAVGVLLFVAMLILLGMQGGAIQSPPGMSQATLGLQTDATLYSASVSRFKGKSTGVEVQDSWTVAGMKDAWHSGGWLRDPTWRRRYVSFIAILFIMTGALGIVIVSAPAWIALLFAMALLYFLIRLTWGFWRA